METKTLKTLKTYVIRAIKKEQMAQNPFDSYKVKGQKVEMVYLTRREVARLEELYDTLTDLSLKRTLQSFLFCCFCGGIRVGDLPFLNQHNKSLSEIHYVPNKTRESSSKVIRIPINKKARKHINPAGKIVPTYCSQVMNRHLKTLAQLAEIEKPITFHVSRHTFATLFLQMGGKVEVLKELMGHSAIKSTMQYVHVTDQSKHSQMDAMDNL